jgi:hypothetical protein
MRKMTYHMRILLIIGMVSSILLFSQYADGFSTCTARRGNDINRLGQNNKQHTTRGKRKSATELFVGSSIDADGNEQQQQQQQQEEQLLINDESKKSLLKTTDTEDQESSTTTSSSSNILSSLWSMLSGRGRPPLQVDDTNILYYDVFLLINLSASISFWVVHRMNFAYIASSFNEGALLSICWIIAGLANGAFLYSAVDGHYTGYENSDKGGPKAAGLLGLSTFIGTSSIRVLIALTCAICQHRPVGVGGEELIPLEIVTGLVLMSLWRALHSAYTPRI